MDETKVNVDLLYGCVIPRRESAALMVWPNLTRWERFVDGCMEIIEYVVVPALLLTAMVGCFLFAAVSASHLF